jgi:hypothetical protein
MGETGKAADLAVRAALEETVQLESRPVGSAAAMPAATADCANSRRVGRKLEWSSPSDHKTAEQESGSPSRVLWRVMKYFAPLPLRNALSIKGLDTLQCHRLCL